MLKTESVIETISGQAVRMNRLTISAKTRVQMSCNYGNPAQNKYDTIEIKLLVSYAYDSTGAILDSMLNEINNYVEEQETWAKKHNTDNDFTLRPFYKSFFLKDGIATPFIKTMGEKPGDYQMFYVNQHVYKIQLLESNGLGSLSSFVNQNMYFIKDNNPLDLGEYIKNTEKTREILKKMR